jgi:hypothetical protein
VINELIKFIEYYHYHFRQKAGPSQPVNELIEAMRFSDAESNERNSLSINQTNQSFD